MLQDSLAAEIEGTMRKELSLEDPECEEQKYVPHIIRFAVCFTYNAFFYICILCFESLPQEQEFGKYKLILPQIPNM